MPSTWTVSLIGECARRGRVGEALLSHRPPGAAVGGFPAEEPGAPIAMGGRLGAMKSSPRNHRSPAVQPGSSRRARAAASGARSVLAAIRAGAWLWSSSRRRCTYGSSPRRPQRPQTVRVADHGAGAVRSARAGSARLLTGGAFPGAPIGRGRAVHAGDSQATPAPVDSSLESRPARRPMPVGTTGRTITASTTPRPRHPPTHFPPARSAADLKRAEDASGPSTHEHSRGSDRCRAYDAGRGHAAPAGHRGTDRSHDCRDEVSRQTEDRARGVAGIQPGLRAAGRAGDQGGLPIGRRPQAAARIPGARGAAGAVRVLRRLRSRRLAPAPTRGAAATPPSARRSGSRIVRLTDREWTFSLARDGSSWQILDARMQ